MTSSATPTATPLPCEVTWRKESKISNKYKLLAVDIDGTLVDGDGRISTANREALALAVEAGIHVCLATGRSVCSSGRYIDELGLDNHHVFFDGALVSRPATGEQIEARYIEAALVFEMIGAAREQGIDLELYSAGGYFAGREMWSTEANRRYFGLEARIGDLAGLCRGERILRAQVVAMDAAEQSRAEEYIRRFGARLDFTLARSAAHPDTIFNNIVSPGVSKGGALLALAGHLGIPREETAAVGDWINDISMIEAAGLGIAMGNACEEVKHIADRVTMDVSEDGLAAAIRELLI